MPLQGKWHWHRWTAWPQGQVSGYPSANWARNWSGTRHGSWSGVPRSLFPCDGRGLEMGVVEMLTQNRCWFCWTTGFFFGENAALSAFSWFVWGRETVLRVRGVWVVRHFMNASLSTTQFYVLCCFIEVCPLCYMLPMLLCFYVVWATSAGLLGCLHYTHVLDHALGGGDQSRRCPGWWSALQGFLIWKGLPSYRRWGVIHSSTGGSFIPPLFLSIGVQVWVNAYESMYDLQMFTSTHIDACKSIYGI